jgi:hypothetical protein
MRPPLLVLPATHPVVDRFDLLSNQLRGEPLCAPWQGTPLSEEEIAARHFVTPAMVKQRPCLVAARTA